MIVWYRYKIFNLEEVEETGLVFKDFQIFLTDIGLKTVSYCKGFYSSIKYDDQFLPINFEGQNPYRNPEGTFGVYLDENSDVHLEVAVEEEE